MMKLDQSNKDNEGSGKHPTVIILKQQHLTPKVVIDSLKHFKAIYTDHMGEYEFEIRKQGRKWTIKSAEQELGAYENARFIKWNFESQLATYCPKVLG